MWLGAGLSAVGVSCEDWRFFMITVPVILLQSWNTGTDTVKSPKRP